VTGCDHITIFMTKVVALQSNMLWKMTCMFFVDTMMNFHNVTYECSFQVLDECKAKCDMNEVHGVEHDR
jgi:hypothetical protein